MRWTSEFLVGLFALVALALFTFFTIRLGQFAWRDTQCWTVRFPDVSGLKDGDPVLALGARIGKVRDLEFKGDHILAVLDIHKPIDLHDDYKIDIRSPSILASHHIFIQPGTPDKPVLTDCLELKGHPAGGLLGDSVGRIMDDPRISKWESCACREDPDGTPDPRFPNVKRWMFAGWAAC